MMTPPNASSLIVLGVKDFGARADAARSFVEALQKSGVQAHLLWTGRTLRDTESTQLGGKGNKPTEEIIRLLAQAGIIEKE